MAKIKLNAVLPISILDELIPAFEALNSQTLAVGITDAQGTFYYGRLPVDHPQCATAVVRVNHETIAQVHIFANISDAPVAAATTFLAITLSHLAAETWRQQQFADEVLARYDELNLIYNLGTSFVQGVSREDLFKSVLDETNRILHADAGIIYGWDTTRGNMVPVSFFGTQFAVDAWNNRVREVALNTLNAYDDAQLFDADKIICAPLRYNEQLLGALVLVYESGEKVFRASDVNLLTTLAQNTSLFIYAVRLMNELAQRNSEIETALNELKQARDQLSRSERLSIIGQTVGDLVHDMRTPMNIILGYAGMLQEPNISAEERHQFAGEIVKYVTVFTAMTQEILDYVQGEDRIKKAPTPVEAVMEQVNSLLMPPGLEQPVAIIFKYDTARGSIINVDSQRFVRVFQNLVNNSIDAIEAGGGTQVEITAQTDKDTVYFSVTDDGPGVPQDMVHSIFEPGVTSKRKGNGLGLAIVKRMIVAHGGDIYYEGAPGHGARFVFTVPVNGNHTSD